MLIQIIPFTENDIPNLISWVDKPGASDLWASRTYQYPLSEQIVLKHLKKTSWSPKELFVFKITSSECENPVGHVELDKFDHHSQSARITRLFIDPKLRNNGIAGLAMRHLLKHCFEDLKLSRVEILAIETNKAALNLYEKIGFKREGFLRENMVLSGKRLGSHLLSMLKDEYFNLSYPL